MSKRFDPKKEIKRLRTHPRSKVAQFRAIQRFAHRVGVSLVLTNITQEAQALFAFVLSKVPNEKYSKSELLDMAAEEGVVTSSIRLEVESPKKSLLGEIAKL